MFAEQLDILQFCLNQQEKEEIKDGILIKRVEKLPCKPSSSITAIGYNQLEHILYVQWHTGTTNRYFNVPPTLWNQLMTTTGSIGKLYHQLIKGNYRGENVDNLI
ncbi:MAG TPA: hypothetical protein DCF68_16685 [Cyanothece sp. UBA12306]|nr:hypothetical protein [Cyanothece sp. UBA12306]